MAAFLVVLMVSLVHYQLCVCVCVCVSVCVCSVVQSCLTLCDPMDCSSPGCTVHGNFLARILEWIAISYSRGFSWPRDQTVSLAYSALAGRPFTTRTTWEAPHNQLHHHRQKRHPLTFIWMKCSGSLLLPLYVPDDPILLTSLTHFHHLEFSYASTHSPVLTWPTESLVHQDLVVPAWCGHCLYFFWPLQTNTLLGDI